MVSKIGNMPGRHIWDHRPVQLDQNHSSTTTDSYVQSSEPHWLARIPLLGKALPFLMMTGCASSWSPEVKVGVGAAATIGVAGLLAFLNRKKSRRKIAALPSPVQILKFGAPRIRFPRRLDAPEKVMSYYLKKGFDESTARKVLYVWFLQNRIYSKTIGDLNKHDLERRDLYGIAADFSRLAGHTFDSELLEKVEGVGYSRYLGRLFNALDMGISVVPELANIFLAMNIIAYHKYDAGIHKSGYAGLQYILSKYGGRLSEQYLIREADVQRMLEVESGYHVNDNRIVQGLTHLLCGGMALDAYEAGQYDEGLQLSFAHIWKARSLFEDPRVLEDERFRGRDSVGTIVEKHSDDLINRARSLWKRVFPGKLHPKDQWSPDMCSQTLDMLRHFAVEPA